MKNNEFNNEENDDEFDRFDEEEYDEEEYDSSLADELEKEDLIYTSSDVFELKNIFEEIKNNIFGEFNKDIFKRILMIFEKTTYILKLLENEKKLFLKNGKDSKEYKSNHFDLLEALYFEKEIYNKYFFDSNENLDIFYIIDQYIKSDTDYYADKNITVSANRLFDDSFHLLKSKKILFRMRNYFFSLSVPKLSDEILLRPNLIDFWELDEYKHLINRIDEYSNNQENEEIGFLRKQEQYEDLKISILFSSNILTDNYYLCKKLLGFDYAYEMCENKKIMDKKTLIFLNSYDEYISSKNGFMVLNSIDINDDDIFLYYEGLIEFNLSKLNEEEVRMILNHEKESQKIKINKLDNIYKNTIERRKK